LLNAEENNRKKHKLVNDSLPMKQHNIKRCLKDVFKKFFINLMEGCNPNIPKLFYNWPKTIFGPSVVVKYAFKKTNSRNNIKVKLSRQSTLSV
jgi:hypothetical protein